jgi:hypothetical protein
MSETAVKDKIPTLIMKHQSHGLFKMASPKPSHPSILSKGHRRSIGLIPQLLHHCFLKIILHHKAIVISFVVVHPSSCPKCELQAPSVDKPASFGMSNSCCCGILIGCMESRPAPFGIRVASCGVCVDLSLRGVCSACAGAFDGSKGTAVQVSFLCDQVDKEGMGWTDHHHSQML